MSNGTATEKDRAREQAKCQLESIREMVRNLRTADAARNKGAEDAEDSYEIARQEIEEDALSAEVREDWHTPGGDADQEYRLLLCTGGPAVQVVGDLNKYHEPETAKLQYQEKLQYQDLFTEWTDYPLDSDEEADVITYAQCFCFAG